MGSRVLFPLTAIVLIGVFAVLSFAETGTQSGSGADGKLTDDDGGAPLFSAPALRPGEQVNSCIKVNYSGSKEIPVTLSGKGSGALDQYLDVEVEGGSGGGFGDCAGFTGTSIFKGTLAEFLRTGDSAQSALPAWTASEAASSRTFRISVALRDVAAAEGQTASANFEWSAPGEDKPVPAPEGSDPVPATPPVATPAAKPPKTSSAGPEQPPFKSSPSRDAPDESTPVPGGPPPAGDDNGFLDRLKDIVVGAGKRVAFPSILALLAFLFVLIQNRLDRKDPKLALAPKTRDEDLEFGPLPWAGAGAP